MKTAKNHDKISSIDGRHPHPEIVLIGQPNCGKSTIFNSVAGYKSISTNFPGATVEYTRSHVAIDGRMCNLVDLPGIYSLTALDKAAEESKRYLLGERIDVLINVVDASILGRSLELTLQLLELDLPMVLCLNMQDEAERKGIEIDAEKLSKLLGIPVVATIGAKGIGLDGLFRDAIRAISEPRLPLSLPLSRHVEDKISAVEQKVQFDKPCKLNFNKRLIAIKLLEEDPLFEHEFCTIDDDLAKQLKFVKAELTKEHGAPPDAVISAERHNLAMQLFEKTATIKRPHQKWTDRIDDIFMHPFLGYVSMLLILALFFNTIFKFGAIVEQPLLNGLQTALAFATSGLDPSNLLYNVVYSSFQGISGGIAIVLPYLVPFLIGLAIIEDIGYLPRIAFLLDSFMHKIGLHGTAVIPGLLGYGCSVPAIMATRILSSPRDRFIASVVAVLIPCSARMVIIMGLVGYYLGGNAALGIYLLNLVVVTLVGGIMARLMPEDVPGMILEMPSYHRPQLNVILAKTWLRLREFIVIAWPLLILGSLILGLAEWFHLDNLINQMIRPITYILDLPSQVGTTLIFGILRKELSMLMLFQALGTQDIISVMSKSQILVFTLFVVFYIPCLATLGVMGKEIGWKKTLLASGVTLVLAIGIGLAGRVVGMLVY
jgi:ferrous iron transport protein B